MADAVDLHSSREGAVSHSENGKNVPNGILSVFLAIILLSSVICRGSSALERCLLRSALLFQAVVRAVVR